MDKIDPKKDLKPLYQAAVGEPVLVTVPPLRYLMVDGQGDPNTSERYAQAVEALFAVSYTVKFAVKKGPQALDYAVMPLEGLWWADDPQAFVTGDKAQWHWTLMILQPVWATAELIEAAMAEVRRKKRLPGLDRLRLEPFEEGLCAQVLHVGPFANEGPTIERLHAFVHTHGQLRGKHHEIYLSDIRRAAPERWKTILRQPVG
jgi:hypothetical protein